MLNMTDSFVTSGQNSEKTYKAFAWALQRLSTPNPMGFSDFGGFSWRSGCFEALKKAIRMPT